MRLIGINDTTPTLVHGNISAVAYRQLCEALKPLTKEELWKVLDHYLFHCLTDSDVLTLVRGLSDMQKTGVPLTAEAALSLIPAEPLAHRVFQNTYPVTALPTVEELEQSKNFLDLLFDETYFESYTPPELRQPTAQVLIDYTTEQGLPTMAHWHFYLAADVVEG